MLLSTRKRLWTTTTMVRWSSTVDRFIGCFIVPSVLKAMRASIQRSPNKLNTRSIFLESRSLLSRNANAWQKRRKSQQGVERRIGRIGSIEWRRCVAAPHKLSTFDYLSHIAESSGSCWHSRSANWKATASHLFMWFAYEARYFPLPWANTKRRACGNGASRPIDNTTHAL